MDVDELAFRMVKAFKDADPYGFADAYDDMEEAVRDAAQQLVNDPLVAVSGLLDLIEEPVYG